jgi:hypothetical protein
MPKLNGSADELELKILWKQLRESPDDELHGLAHRDASILETVSEKQKQQIEAECARLTGEAKTLESQIKELTGPRLLGRGRCECASRF